MSTIALKEWDVVCQAMARGEQIITLRKGGITDHAFAVRPAHSSFFLYPTGEHQHAAAIRQPFRSLLQPVHSTDNLLLNVWVEVVNMAMVPSEQNAKSLSRLTVWTEAAMADRFRRYPDRPMWLLILRAYTIVPPLSLPYDPSYAGCHSWVPLMPDLHAEKTIPVLTDSEFESRRQEALRLNAG